MENITILKADFNKRNELDVNGTIDIPQVEVFRVLDILNEHYLNTAETELYENDDYDVKEEKHYDRYYKIDFNNLSSHLVYHDGQIIGFAIIIKNENINNYVIVPLDSRSSRSFRIGYSGESTSRYLIVNEARFVLKDSIPEGTTIKELHRLEFECTETCLY